MRERDAAQAVIVGAGVVGASIAYRLARAGARVTLIDRGEPGQGTSANSFAWVNSNDKTPRPYHRLNAESVIAHRRLRDDALADLARRSDRGTGAAACAAMPPARETPR